MSTLLQRVVSSLFPEVLAHEPNLVSLGFISSILEVVQ